MQQVSQAVFLVGGKGTRLGALTRSIPKPLLPLVDDFCLLDFLIEEAARHGFTDILLLAGYCGDLVEERYRDKKIHGSTIRVLREPTPLGTAGCLKLAEDMLDPWFLLANGDSFFDMNLRALMVGDETGFDARIALREVDDVSRFGAVAHEDGRVSAFKEKTESGSGRGDINAGVYLISKRVVKMIDGPTSMETEIFPALVEQGKLQAAKFDGYFIDMGLPDTYERACLEIPARRTRPCVFLDRDGVLNIDHGYTHKIDNLQWVQGAQEAVLALNDAGYFVIVISNQAGVARGFYSTDDVDKFHTEMNRQLAEIGAHIDSFYYCPFHADGTVEEYTHPNHPDRKPNPGMLQKALSSWPIDTGATFMVGDKTSDVDAARAADIDGLLFEGGDLERFLKQAERI